MVFSVWILKLRDKYSTMIEDPNGKYHQGIYIDVFPFDKTPRSKVLRNLQRSLYKSLITGSYQNVKKKVTDTRYLRRLCLAQIYKLINVTSVENAILSFYKLDRNFFYRPSLASKADDYYFTEDEIFPLTTIPFEGIDFCAPNKTNVYLEKLYGNYMALPTEDKRKPSHLKSADPFVHCDHADVLEWKERQA
jgi:lipopolysaccharide cholinephosphotransferase